MCFHCGEPFVSGWLLETVDGVAKGCGAEFPEFPADGSFESSPTKVVQTALTDAIEAFVASQDGNTAIRMQWRSGDFAITDNLAVAHYATPGTQDDAAGLRILHRTTIVGGDETIPKSTTGRSSFYLT